MHDGLVARVRDAQQAADDLAGQVTVAEARLAREQDRALASSGPLARHVNRDEFAAGQVPVHGPGLVVTLREPPAANASPSPGRGGAGSGDATNILGDRDVRSVVNELWHDGAEAIAVNGIRLTPTSSIRVAGQTVLVDFQPIGAPYTVEAIGAADDLATNFAQSAVASRYQTLKGADHIGFDFSESTALSLPGQRAGHAALREGRPQVIAALALVVGVVVGLILRPTVPNWLEPYLPIAVVAALDAVFGGIRARLDGIFDAKVFVVSFISNVLVAALIVFLGDKLGVGGQLSTAVVVVLGIRIFGNAAAIRRHLFHA